jgi:hypothetical protein
MPQLRDKSQIFISEVLPPTPPVWQLVPKTLNIQLPGSEREVETYKVTDTGGEVEQDIGWRTGDALAFDVKKDDSNAVHVLLQTLFDGNTQVLVNAHIGPNAVIAHEGLASLNLYRPSGTTDQAVDVWNASFTPEHGWDHTATPAS